MLATKCQKLTRESRPTVDVVSYPDNAAAIAGQSGATSEDLCLVLTEADLLELAVCEVNYEVI